MKILSVILQKDYACLVSLLLNKLSSSALSFSKSGIIAQIFHDIISYMYQSVAMIILSAKSFIKNRDIVSLEGKDIEICINKQI